MTKISGRHFLITLRSAMPLQPFSFPVPETRFLKAGSLIYKFKIRGGTSYSEDKDFKGECFNQELEDIIRTVLGNLDHLEPFSTARHLVFPYKSPWGKAHKHTTKKRKLYPFIITLYVEKNMHKRKQPEEEETRHISSGSNESRSKRRCGDSPLEEAVLKKLFRMEGENSKVEWDHQRSEEEEDEEEEDEEEEVTEDPTLPYEPETTPEEERTPERPGILKRLARNVFPFIFKP